MSDTIVIPVPERLLAVYAVATAEPVDSSALRSSGGVAVDVVPVDAAPLPAAALLRAMGASTEALAKLGSATEAALVRSIGGPGMPPGSEMAAYATAQALAEVYDGVLVDTVIPRVVDSPRGVGDDFRLADWVVLPHSATDDGLWFTTKGLVRFGMPELQSHCVPESASNAWGAVLTGVAQVLTEHLGAALREDPTRAFVELPAQLDLRLRDIAAGYSDRSRSADDPGLDVSASMCVVWDPAPQEGAESFLTVQPPRHTAEPATEWTTGVVRTLFGAAGG
ncbi:MAG TPA: hypothetical protein VFJ14_16065 [Nocardioidaceae bacterium]|nr:hypothetical protein [Nocardioidaceae bacterium]